ncbi:MAG: AMP-binding protein [Deltaproteobacteria bacterium]|nr:AMP-binding protein [Deltaproteobacteria bacterium]
MGADIEASSERQRRPSVLCGPTSSSSVTSASPTLAGVLLHRLRVDTGVEASVDVDDAEREASAPWLTVYEGKNGIAWSPKEIFDLALRWAMALHERGVRPEDRVVIFLPNGSDFVGAFLGAQFLRATPVPIAWPFFFDNLEKKIADLRPLLDVATPAAVVTTDRAQAAGAWFPAVLTKPLEPSMATMPRPDVLADEAIASSDGEAPAFIQFTSGSTGSPRGAVISHRAALASTLAMGRGLNLTSEDVGVSWLPLFHDMGLVGALFTSLAYRFPLHLMTPSEFLLHPKRWLELISHVGATITVAPNFGYDTVTRRVRNLDGLDLSTLRVALNGSEPVHRTTIDAFETRFADAKLRRGTVLPVYGLAENTLGVAFPTPRAASVHSVTAHSATQDSTTEDSATEDLVWGGRAVPSVGRPLVDTVVEVRSSNGRICLEGEEGEIWVRSPSLLSGYYRDPLATSRVLVDGWLATGDLGVIANDQLYVTGREKELIIKGGQKFHPYEIENVVAEAIGVPLNQVAAVSIIQPDRGTEDLAIVIERRIESQAEQEELQKRTRGRLTESLAVRAEHILFVAAGSIPRTTSGKLRRRACAEKLKDLR